MAVFLNDRFLDDQDAQLPIADLSIQRGYAIFDFFRTVHARPLFLEDHLERFYASAVAMGLAIKQHPDELQAILLELIEKSALQEAGVRLMLTGGNSPDGFSVADANLLLSCKPVQTADAATFSRGIQVLSYEYQRDLPHIKSINYQMAIWLQPFLKEKKADEVLYQQNGVVTEFPRANVFMVAKDNTLLTPAKAVLAGITRKKVLALAPKIMSVTERDISITELENAAEVFLTSTTRRLLPVVRVNGKTIGAGEPGPFTRRLYAQFLTLEKEMVG
jgi:D-alanine transaminase/branched-chain amino acid aminotransferase